tara:strand:- start:3482 stop:4954 length:1473 start_codon:yes stop_codon:yes gene_type:complete
MENNKPDLLPNTPDASSLIESLRDIGYTFKAALADIIDNSIAANSTRIEINVRWASAKPVIWIKDNGAGMTEKELFLAMKPGSRNPTESRHEDDLGRFGLGLKTASFSQCRRLTVVSKKKRSLSGYRWDLDLVAQKKEWLIEKLSKQQIDEFRDQLSSSGTLVIWESVDRLVDSTSSDPEISFNEILDQARSHIELVFHRFMQGIGKKDKVVITINGDTLSPFDPFNRQNSATQHLPKESISVGGGTVVIEPFILPHHSKCSREEFERHAGADGYTKNQGFYVYRNKRLIEHGTWFRLAPMSDANRLARVLIDIGNESDHLWKVDVKKSRIIPPSKIRNELKRVIDQITTRSKRAYSRRGYTRRHKDATPLWERHASQGRIDYKIKRDHPVVDQLLSFMEEDGERLNNLLKLIEGSFPCNQLFADMSADPKAVDRDKDEREVLLIGLELLREMREIGVPEASIQATLKMSEPFSLYDGLFEKILKESGNG